MSLNGAERQYQAVEPENRLVVRTLENNWEKALVQLRNLEEEYERFCQSLPTELTEKDQRRIESLAKDIPALWSAESTSHADRKEIVRCLIERLIVQTEKDRELVDVTICWRGGATSQHRMTRPIASCEQQRDFKSLMDRLIELRLSGSDIIFSVCKYSPKLGDAHREFTILRFSNGFHGSSPSKSRLC